MTDLTLTLSRRMDAPAAAVYAAWLDPALLTRFMANCQGMVLTRAETDPRVGGRFLLVMGSQGREVPHTGTYLDLVPARRIVFTWESPYSTMEGSTVTIDLAEEAGHTMLTLTHRRFETESSRDGHRGGWAVILDGLVAFHQAAPA